MYAQSGGLDASDQKEVIEGVSDVVAYLGKDLIWQGLQRLMKPPAEVLNAMFLSQIMLVKVPGKVPGKVPKGPRKVPGKVSWWWTRAQEKTRKGSQKGSRKGFPRSIKNEKH